MVVLAVEKVLSMGVLFRITRFTYTRGTTSPHLRMKVPISGMVYIWQPRKAYAEEGGCIVVYTWDGPESQWSSAMEIHQRRHLTEQMRQSEDPEFAAALRKFRLHRPTPEDIEIVNSRVGTPLESPTSIPIFVRRHNLHEALNK
jgi:hypothetical protein